MILMRHSIASYLLLSLFGLGLTLGCSTTSPPSQSVKPPVSGPEAIKVSARVGWLPQQINGDRKYFIHDSLMVSINTDTSQYRSSETSIFYSIRVSHSNDSLLLMTKVDSLLMISQFPSLKVPVNVDTVREFQTIMSPTGQLFLLSQDSTSVCPSGVTPLAVRIYEMMISYPKRALKVGDSWTDTVSMIVCRGKIPLQQHAVRNYRILDFTTWKQLPAVSIRRIISSVLSADSKDKRNHYEVAGSGESSTLIYANQATGVLLQSDTKSESAITIHSSRGVFPFRQITSTHIELR